MFAVMLEKEFLPTDPQFGDKSAFLDWSESAFWIVVISLAVMTIISVTLEDELSKPLPAQLAKIASRVLMVAVFAFTVATLMSAINHYDAQEEAREVAKGNLITNIQTVYDVEVVQGLDNYNVSPDSKPELSVIQDEVAYEVFLKQNPETYEPTLIMVASPDAEVRELRKK